MSGTIVRTSDFENPDPKHGQGYTSLGYSLNPGLNKLSNGSFEVDADGIAPTNWDVDAGAAEVDSAEKYDGDNSLLLYDEALATVSQGLKVKVGQYIKVSIACKTAEEDHASIAAEIDGVPIAQDAWHTGGDEWEILSFTYGPVLLANHDDTFTFQLTKEAVDANVWFDQAVMLVSGGPLADSQKKIVTIDDGDSPYTALVSDVIIICDTSAGAIIINLYEPGFKIGKPLTIKNIGTNTVTVNAVGETAEIDDETSQILNQYDALKIVSDGTEWWVI